MISQVVSLSAVAVFGWEVVQSEALDRLLENILIRFIASIVLVRVDLDIQEYVCKLLPCVSF